MSKLRQFLWNLKVKYKIWKLTYDLNKVLRKVEKQVYKETGIVCTLKARLADKSKEATHTASERLH